MRQERLQLLIFGLECEQVMRTTNLLLDIDVSKERLLVTIFLSNFARSFSIIETTCFYLQRMSLPDSS